MLNKKRTLLELLFFIIIIFMYDIFIERVNNLVCPLIPIAIINIIFCIFVGMLINSVNKNISFVFLKFNISRFVIFLLSIIIIVLLWVLYKYLPLIVTKNFTVIYCLISIYAGANLLSAMIDGKEIIRK